jgi:4-hydroxy-tetrahydrodipicolinate synthase
MISPFTLEGSVDGPAVAKVVDHLLAGGVHGIFALGTTGEAMLIHRADKQKLVTETVRAVNGRSMVYAGISGNSLRVSLELANDYADLGVDALVAHPPTYYELFDREIEAYFLRLADEVKLPLVLYNIPQTTRHSISLDVVDRLRKHENIVAIKDSANDPARLSALLTRVGGRDGFPVLLGCSAQYAHGLKAGGVGLVPSGAHLVPDKYVAMYNAAMHHQWERVDALQKETEAACRPYLAGRGIGQGIAALKAMLERHGICGRTVLSPLLNHED